MRFSEDGTQSMAAEEIGGLSPEITSTSFVGMLRSIVPAPVAPDGTVAGAQTDFVINFAVDKRPNAPGLSFEPGDRVEVKLPDGIEFVDPVNFPISKALMPGCAPPVLTCSTAVFLRGWPQSPIAPAISYDAASNTLTAEVETAIVPNPPAAPGVKELHIIGLGFKNPEPGRYRVDVTITRGDSVETGSATLKIKSKPRPSIHIASVFNPPQAPFPNTVHQTVAAGTLPLPYDFYVWGWNRDALLGVELEPISKRWSRLVQNGRTIGWVKVTAVRGGSLSGASITSTGPSVPVNAFITGITTGRLTVQFDPGTQPGLYILNFMIRGGNMTQTKVTVTP